MQWRIYSEIDIEEDVEILDLASKIWRLGIKEIDSLHVACAIKAKAEYFLTTDDGIRKKAMHINKIKIIDPIDFIKEVIL